MYSKVRIYSDGGARGNPGPAAIGVLICDERDKPIQEFRRVIGQTTNNVAEYSAVIEGLIFAHKLGAREVEYFTDSQLVQRQLTGRYRIKTPHILELYRKVKDEEKQFQKITYHHVLRTHERIKHVDRLVNRALDGA